MKKILSVFLAVLMCVLPLAGNMTVMAADVDATYTFGNAEGYAGEEITVDVNLVIDAQFNTIGFAGLEYDKNSLTFVKCVINKELSDMCALKKFDKNQMTLVAALKTEDEETGDSIPAPTEFDGLVCTFTFKINEDAPVGSTNITISNPQVKMDSKLITAGVEAGTIKVLGKDFEGLKFESKTVTYDSQNHNIEVTGVPEEATVEYTVDKKAFSGAEDAGTYNVVATVKAPGYNEESLNATLTINKKEITVNAVVADKVYDGTDAVAGLVGVPAIDGYIQGDDLSIDQESLATVKFASKDVGTHAIEHEIEVIGSDKDNYEYTINVPKASITKRPASIVAEDKTVKVGEDLPVLTAVVNGVVEGETLDYTVTTTAKNTNAVKNYPITVKADAKKNPNYDITTTNAVLYVIDKTAQDVTVSPVEGKTYGDDDFMLEVSVGETANESKVTYTSETPDVVTVTDEGCVMIAGAGTAKVTVSKAGDEEYADFSETVTFTVAKKSLTITADNKTVRVGNEMPKLTYQTEGLLKEDVLTGELATTAKNTNTVKDYPITQGTLKASANYDVTFVPGTLSVIAKLEQEVEITPIADVTYGDGSVELVVELGEKVTDSLVVYTAETNNVSVDQDGYVTILGAGTAKITVSKAGDTDYADFEETVTFTVNKKDVTVTADDKTATKGGEIPELTYTVEGLVDGDVIEAALTTTAKNTNTVKDYPITVKVTVKNYPNYNITLVNGTLSVIDKIPQDITVTSNAPSDITYGDEGFKIDVAYGDTVTEAETVFASDDEEVVTVDAQGNVTIIGAGEVVITVSKAGNDTIADFKEEIEVVVAKKPITVTANDASKKVGASDPELTYTVTGTLVGGDAFTGNVLREEGEEVGTYIIGPGKLALTNSKNYDVNFIGGTFTIFDKTPQDIEVASVYEKTYGDEGFKLDVQYGESNVSSEVTTFVSNNENVATVDAEGNVVIVGAGTAKITVAKKGDADLADFAKTVTVTVAKKAVKVIANAQEKYVGEATPKLTYTLEGELVGNDEFTGELTVSDGDKAGKSYDIKIGTLALNDNYKVTFVGAKLKVLAKLDQDITFIAPEEVMYGTLTLTWYVNLGEEVNKNGVLTITSSNEDVAILECDMGIESSSIIVKSVGKTVLTAKYTGNEKYNDWEDSITLVVKKCPYVVTVEDKIKKIGNAEPEYTFSLETHEYGPGGENLENGTLGVTITREEGEELGKYDITAVVDVDTALYDVKVNKGTLTIIDKLPSTVVTEAEIEKTYGDDSFEIEADVAEIQLPGEGFSLPFRYSSDNENVVMFPEENGAVAMIVGAGTATVTVYYDGDSEYGASSADIEVTILPKEIVIKELDLGEKTVVFDGMLEADADSVSIDFSKLTVVPEDVEEGQTPANYVVTGFELAGDGSANYVLTTESVLVPVSEEIVFVEVTAVAENGTVEGTGSYLEGTEVTVKAVADKGYKFDCWYVGEEKVSSEDEYTFIADEDIELTAAFKKKSSGSVSSSGGSAPSRVVYFQVDENTTTRTTVSKGAKVARPEDPEREGYTFEGWYADAEFTEEFDFSTEINDSITVYAKWTAVEEEPEDPENPDEPDKPGEGEEGEDGKEWTNPYTDVKENDWFYETVKTASDKGLMNGMTETTFAPNEVLTRAMLVTILYRADGEAKADGEVGFEDVDLDAYYGDALVWATANGIVNGYSETEFAPNAKITREQIAAILLRYAIYKGIEAVDLSENLSFGDAEEISEYAVSSMNWVVGQEIMTGYEDNTIRPQNDATRAEVATIVVRFLAKLA